MLDILVDGKFRLQRPSHFLCTVPDRCRIDGNLQVSGLPRPDQPFLLRYWKLQPRSKGFLLAIAGTLGQYSQQLLRPIVLIG